SDRADTLVEVSPTNPAKKSDVTAAEQTLVNYGNGVLTVKVPKTWRRHVASNSASVDVKIELPSGSRLRGEAGVGRLRTTGVLGECTFKVGAGDIQLTQAGPLQLRTGVGDITIERADEHSEITTGSGTIHLSRVEGPAVIKNANGDIRVGEARADLRTTTSNGKIWVALARSDVEAKTANGSVQIDEVMHGSVHAQTAMGKVEVGVRRGVAALLDLETSFGKVVNDLDASEAPQPGEPSVEVRARTGFGDIRLFRAGGPETMESPAFFEGTDHD
ncbi:MAG TPA: DUF4097 family beta strand repeat-containing protein, partial [Acidimicrobiales bacterium]|nr:DUF4097 family beta strand repeat-containing protein [Acidimicrobiales bacterium]